MKTTIHTTFDCLIVFDNQQQHIEKNESFCFDFSGKVCVYPTDKSNMISFCIDGALSPFYHVIEKENERHIFLFDGLAVEDVTVHNATFSGGTGKIEKFSDRIVFSCKEHKKNISLRHHYEDFMIDSFFHIGFALLFSKTESHLIFFNFKNGRCKIFEGEKILANRPNFEVFNQGKSLSLTISKDGLRQKDKNNTVILENPLFPYLSFVQALKEENYSFCHCLLSPSLQQNQSEEDIKNFFGQVQYFFPLSYNQVFILSQDKGLIYTFSYENNKISDIFDD